MKQKYKAEIQSGNTKRKYIAERLSRNTKTNTVLKHRISVKTGTKNKSRSVQKNTEGTGEKTLT